jgi:N-acetyl-anhydromuramyl-L-alanine amidase AmpD
MKTSEFLDTLSGLSGKARERFVLQTIRGGAALPIRWCELSSYAGGHQAVLRVAEDALAVGTQEDWVRVTMCHSTAQLVADSLNARLPTSRISNLVHAQAEVRLKPCLQKPDAQMASAARMLQHHQAVERQRSGRSGLVSTVGKDWVLTNRLVGNPLHAANYGWHDHSAPNGVVWQTVGLRHDRFHVDYSQVVRLVHNEVLVDGAPMPFDDVLVHPELCTLLSSEGRMQITRHPGVPTNSDSALEAGDEEADRPADNSLPDILHLGAKNYRRASGRSVDLIVLHTMEAAEKPTTAEAVARWFGGPQAPMASAHYCVDGDSIVRSVHEEDIAWHAPGANHNGIGIEHAGFAAQGPAEWADDYSRAMLDLSARLVADICRRRSIPVAMVDEAGLQSGVRGITTHAVVSRAFRRSTHTDPGKSFPMEAYLRRVRAYI